MKKISFSEILGITVFLVGILVMAGWVLDIAVLKSILPHWVTMKFSTSLSFFLSGFTLYLIARSMAGESSVTQTGLPIAALGLLFLMGALLASTLFGLHSGIEDLFVRETPGAVKSAAPGRPSIGTMVNFILMAIAGILTMLGSPNLNLKLFGIGRIVCVIGSLAVLGYIINLPLLYYTVEGWSTAMALHTAILFVMLGTGLMGLKKGKPGKKAKFIPSRKKMF